MAPIDEREKDRDSWKQNNTRKYESDESVSHRLRLQSSESMTDVIQKMSVGPPVVRPNDSLFSSLPPFSFSQLILETTTTSTMELGRTSHQGYTFALRLSFVLSLLLCLGPMVATTSAAMVTSTATTAASKPRILCLHGLSQSGASFSNKIGGARRKLARHFELDFLDGPISLSEGETTDEQQQMYGWWVRNEQGRHVGVQVPFDYIRQHAQMQKYDALLGFSQGGLLATAIALSGDIPNVKAVVTAGAPYVEDTFQIAVERAASGSILEAGKAIPKLHFAGETDTIIPVERVERLCQEGGNGTLIKHEKGHLFPTKASEVNAMMEFLEEHVLRAKET